MPVVTVVKMLPGVPPREVAKQIVSQHLAELFGLWTEHHGKFIAGKRFAIMAFPPGDYPPSKAGVVRDATAFTQGGGPVRYAFAVSDDHEAEQTPYCLWMLEPDPGFFPDGVAG